MSEETVLKSSIFGGYKKQDVIQYINSVLEENENKVKKLEEQVGLLLKENRRLKAQVSVKEKKQLENSDGNKQIKYISENDNKPIPFPITKGGENHESMSIRQQMELGEGTYFISENDGIVTLPEPTPIYQTKGKNTIPNAVTLGHEENLFEKLKETDEIDIIDELTQRDNSEILQQNQVMKEVCINEVASTYENENLAKEFSLEQMHAELITVKDMLEKEKSERQMISAKLDYSNGLLIQLYKNDKS